MPMKKYTVRSGRGRRKTIDGVMAGVQHGAAVQKATEQRRRDAPPVGWQIQLTAITMIRLIEKLGRADG